MALITAAEVKQIIPGLSAASNDLLDDDLIPRASALLARHCGYPPATVAAAPTLESATYTRYSGDGRVRTDPDNGRLLRLKVWPVTSITSIHEDVEEDFGVDDLVDSGDYTQRGDHGQIVRLTPDSDHGRWTTTEGAIKVVFVAGFSTAPDDLKEAVAEMVAHLYGLRQRRDKSAISDEGRTTSYRRETMPARVRQMISPFRLPGVLL